MSSIRPLAQLETHEVFNQAPPFEDVNLYAGDNALRQAVQKAGGAVHEARLSALGARAGSAAVGPRASSCRSGHRPNHIWR